MTTEYKTIKQVIDTPENHDFMTSADAALNAFSSEGWAVESMFYRQWNDGPDFFVVERFVTLKRELSTQSADSLEFSRLMYSWHMAKRALDTSRSAKDIQAEKDAYFAIVDYIKRPPPALPEDVIQAYETWTRDFQSSKYSNGMIAAIQGHLPERTSP